MFGQSNSEEWQGLLILHEICQHYIGDSLVTEDK